jgi:hypothetical protein
MMGFLVGKWLFLAAFDPTAANAPASGQLSASY